MLRRASLLFALGVPQLMLPAAADSRSGGDAPGWARSLRVLVPELPILVAPDATAPRRGTAVAGVRLPLSRQQAGPGCALPFLEVGPSAWICGQSAELSGNPPVEAEFRLLLPGADGLPFLYFFAGPAGVNTYEDPRTAEDSAPVLELEPGFSLALTEERNVDGTSWGRTRQGTWVRMSQLTPARPSWFEGVRLTNGPSKVAWVMAPNLRVQTREGLIPKGVPPLPRLQAVKLTGAHSDNGNLVELQGGGWLLAASLRQTTQAPAPDAVNTAQGERWIDIDLRTQTLVAYEGERAVFATLISAGKGRDGEPSSTPLGVFRVWAKLLSTTMDNLEDEGAEKLFRMDEVPWVQFFAGGVGLHAAYWHQHFGEPRSHGCINLSPRDAAWLFDWTGPHLHAGWSAAHPSPEDPGTLIRIRVSRPPA